MIKRSIELRDYDTFLMLDDQLEIVLQNSILHIHQKGKVKPKMTQIRNFYKFNKNTDEHRL